MAASEQLCPSTGSEARRALSLEALAILHELWRNHELCDAVVSLEDGASFPVHRAILSACSPFFRTLFTTAVGGARPVEVKIHGVAASHMAAILNYAYVRIMQLDDENVCGVLIASDFLAVMGAKLTCCDFIAGEMRPDNCVAIMKFARFYACPELEEQARGYMMQHFEAVSEDSEDLLELSLEELSEVLSCDELNARCEEVVWHSVLRWLQHDLDARKQHMPQLLGCIRLGLIDAKYFITHVKNHELVVGDPRCRPIVISVLKYMYDASSSSEEEAVPPHACPRLPYELLFTIGGWSAGTPTSSVELYDSRADRWTQLQEEDPEGPRAYHGVAALGGDLYVVGGFNGVNYFNSCRCFSSERRVWREVAPMNARRCYVSVAALDGLLYAMGGYDRPNRQSTAERYNPCTNQWSFIAPMSVQRSDANATTLDGCIYIAGGFTGLECLSSVEVYDPQLDQWRLVANMTSRRSGVSCCAYHGRIYVVGGFNGISRLNSAEVYSPRTNTWTRIADVLQTRSNFMLEVVDDAMYAVGGFNGVTTTASVECYDEVANEWFEVASMRQFRSALAGATVRGLTASKVRGLVSGSRADGAGRRTRRAVSTPVPVPDQDPAPVVQALQPEDSNQEYAVEETDSSSSSEDM
ncbi:kelch-like protein 10 [Bacillus rossius redtenbacheri]|uniref:kelch-like protein 10 n=1 Tax=Bacillus rossius redtenbacheri TaxID=93214 RepID=UPI002FDCB45D